MINSLYRTRMQGATACAARLAQARCAGAELVRCSVRASFRLPPSLALDDRFASDLVLAEEHDEDPQDQDDGDAEQAVSEQGEQPYRSPTCGPPCSPRCRTAITPAVAPRTLSRLSCTRPVTRLRSRCVDPNAVHHMDEVLGSAINHRPDQCLPSAPWGVSACDVPSGTGGHLVSS